MKKILTFIIALAITSSVEAQIDTSIFHISTRDEMQSQVISFGNNHIEVYDTTFNEWIDITKYVINTDKLWAIVKQINADGTVSFRNRRKYNAALRSYVTFVKHN